MIDREQETPPNIDRSSETEGGVGRGESIVSRPSQRVPRRGHTALPCSREPLAAEDPRVTVTLDIWRRRCSWVRFKLPYAAFETLVRQFRL